MRGSEVYSVLKRIGATHLHHANSVTTACTFLEQGSLLSRGSVQDRGLKQTTQPSDEIDKKFGIWHRIFLDHVDIHDRSGRPNQYGPVLFLLQLNILLGLPAGTEILVTKKNPVYWRDNEPSSDRWFQTANELAKTIVFGDFGKMIVIETPLGTVDFPDRRAQIILDDPQRKVSSGENAYSNAENRLAGSVGRVETHIERRKCPTGCNCIQEYAKYTTQKIDAYFI